MQAIRIAMSLPSCKASTIAALSAAIVGGPSSSDHAPASMLMSASRAARA